MHYLLRPTVIGDWCNLFTVCWVQENDKGQASSALKDKLVQKG